MDCSSAKTLVIIGVLLILAGLVAMFRPHIPWIGRLPGDIYIRKPGVVFYFPLATSLLLSAVLSLIAYFFRR